MQGLGGDIDLQGRGVVLRTGRWCSGSSEGVVIEDGLVFVGGVCGCVGNVGMGEVKGETRGDEGVGN